ncbi:MAG: hypothetical protein CVU55_06340 [Deltaproteobacteria bacterium HGW-Deltaproteobacteria-13]|nr:MAG: hypothetical protein CVU55_06340 [Deltaproteobacteria bacterium HGW-Deltaproteobacteria-13]
MIFEFFGLGEHFLSDGVNFLCKCILSEKEFNEPQKAIEYLTNAIQLNPMNVDDKTIYYQAVRPT